MILLIVLFSDNTKNPVQLPKIWNKYYKKCTNSATFQLWKNLVVSSFKQNKNLKKTLKSWSQMYLNEYLTK